MALDRKPFKIKLPICKHCDAVGKHYSWQCPHQPRPTLKTESATSKAKRLAVSQEWFDTHPPDEQGYWQCYLQIAPNCPVNLTKQTIQLEHVEPRVRRPDLKYEVSNLQPACKACNKFKGPWTLEVLAETYPQVRQVIKQLKEQGEHHEDK